MDRPFKKGNCSKLILLEGLWLVYVPPGLTLNIVHFTSVHVYYNKPPLFPDMAFVGWCLMDSVCSLWGVNYPNRSVDLQLVALSLCWGTVVRCTAVNVEVLLSSNFEGVSAKLYFSVLRLVSGLYARWQTCEKRLLSCDTCVLGWKEGFLWNFMLADLAKIVGLKSGLLETVRKYGQFTRGC